MRRDEAVYFGADRAQEGHDPRLHPDPCRFVHARVRHCDAPLFQLIHLNANSESQWLKITLNPQIA
ncbi:MAG: hypothetical protein V7K48_34670 [Nostoc sp.]|uniref:hypothetical protein n=1 Tax=Nostoc sp. TaxID=1180 RepID=UPI002FFACEC2